MTNLEFCLRKGKEEPYKRLTRDIFEAIEEAIKGEKHLLPVRAEYLQWSYDDGSAVVVLEGSTPVGYTRLMPLLAGDDAWYELGGTWVKCDHRGKGVNKQMYSLLLPPHHDKNILATTTNVTSLMVGQELGFVLVPRRALPERVWKYSCCCPLTKTCASNSDNSDCRRAFNEPQSDGEGTCWMRVTKETAERKLLQAVAA